MTSRRILGLFFLAQLPAVACGAGPVDDDDPSASSDRRPEVTSMLGRPLYAPPAGSSAEQEAKL
ncbi:MAG: hypothetical protein ACYSVY_06230, partial [Planctomycetota bacterium]